MKRLSAIFAILALLCKKYMLANNYDERFGGELSHVVVMQYVDEALIDRFIACLEAEK